MLPDMEDPATARHIHNETEAVGNYLLNFTNRKFMELRTTSGRTVKARRRKRLHGIRSRTATLDSIDKSLPTTCRPAQQSRV